MSETRDIVNMLDRWQGRTDAQRCSQDPDHGRLTAHASGTALICGKCGDGVRVDSGMLAEAANAR